MTWRDSLPGDDAAAVVATETTTTATPVTPTPSPNTASNFNPVSVPEPTGTWVFPVLNYSNWSDSFGDPREGGARKHKGNDIFAPAGSPILSVVAGTVKKISYDTGIGGFAITIKGDDGLTYYYAHMDSVPHDGNGQQYEVGAKVNQGQILGGVGSTGNAQSPHLHFGISNSAGDIDPAPFLRNGADGYNYVTQTADGDYTQGGNYSGTGTDSDAPIVLPKGGRFYTVGGVQYVVYEITDGSASGVSSKVFFEIPGSVSAPGGETMSQTAWDQMLEDPAWHDAGSADAFTGVAQGTDWDQLVQDTLMNAGIWGTNAMSDQGVLNLLAEFMARPSMTAKEFDWKLSQTEWGQSHTDDQKTWNDKSKAQQDLELMDNATALIGTWFMYTGEVLEILEYDADGDGVVTPDELQAGNPGLYQASLDVASGVKSQLMVVETWIKPEALKIEGSPWNRTITNEEKAKGALEVGIESNAASVQDLYRDYGIPITWDEALTLGEDVEMMRTSLAEIEQSLDEQAMALYPGKPPGVKTMTYAQPYMQQYKNLMEVPTVGLDDPMLQQAMSDGMTIGDFATALRSDPAWMKTNNARDTHYQVMGQLGRQMGF